MEKYYKASMDSSIASKHINTTTKSFHVILAIKIKIKSIKAESITQL